MQNVGEEGVEIDEVDEEYNMENQDVEEVGEVEEEKYEISKGYKNFGLFCSIVDGFLPLLWCLCCFLWIILLSICYSSIQDPSVRISVVSSVSFVFALLIVFVCMVICFFPFLKDTSKRLLFSNDVKNLHMKDNPMIPQEVRKIDDRKRVTGFMIRFFSWFLCCVCCNVWIMASIIVYIGVIDSERNGFNETTSVSLSVGISVGLILTCLICCFVFIFGTWIARCVTPSEKNGWTDVIKEYIEEIKKIVKTLIEYAKRGKKELEQYIDYKRNRIQSQNNSEDDGEEEKRFERDGEIVRQDMNVVEKVYGDDFSENVVVDLQGRDDVDQNEEN